MNKIILILSVLISSLSFAQVPSYVPTSGLVGWWPFNGNVNDESGNGNNGTVNGPTLTTDRNGNANSAYSFDGVNDYIEVLNSVNMNSQVGSCSFWISTTNNSNLMAPVTKANFNDGSGENFGFYTNILLGNAVSFNTSADGSCDPGGIYINHWHVPNFTDGNWHLVVGTFDSISKIYVDGILLVSENYNTLVDNCAGDLQFGRKTSLSPFWFNGKLDEIGLWTRVLSECEVHDLFYNLLNSATGINAGNDIVNCKGDSVILNGSGGTDYSWSNGIIDNVYFTADSTQSIILTGTNSIGCVGKDTLLMEVLPIPFISAGSDLSVCEGDQVILSGLGASGYLWNNDVTDGVPFIPLQTLTYTVTVTDNNNCSNSDSVKVIVNQPSYSTQSQTSLDSYTWPVNGQTYTQGGTYTATIPDAAGCDSIITLNLSLNFTGVIELNGSTLTLSPNPVQDFVSIIVNSKLIGEEFTILNQLGVIVFKGIIKSEIMEIDLSKYSSGMYLFRLNNYSEKVIRVVKK